MHCSILRVGSVIDKLQKIQYTCSMKNHEQTTPTKEETTEGKVREVETVTKISREKYAFDPFMEALAKETGLSTDILLSPKTEGLVHRLRHARFQSDQEVFDAAVSVDDSEMYAQVYRDVDNKEQFANDKHTAEAFFQMSQLRAQDLLERTLEMHGIDPETMKPIDEEEDDEENPNTLQYLFPDKEDDSAPDLAGTQEKAA